MSTTDDLPQHERVAVAREGELRPGQMLYVNVDGLPIALVNVDGQLYAFNDSCRHQGGPLSSGVLRDNVVTCPWHGWAYDVRTGKSVIPPIGLRIPTYPVTIQDGVIYIDIEW